MTFDEWIKKNWMYIDVKENAKVIWEAAQNEEREACVMACIEVRDEYLRQGRGAQEEAILCAATSDCESAIMQRP